MGRFERGDLPERSFQFAIRVLDVVKSIPDGTIGWLVGKQLAKSGTSIGANIAEADGALTNAEFASICNIARREAAETRYWLRICQHLEYVDFANGDELLTESNELHDVFATIVRKTHKQSQQQSQR